MCLVSGLWHGAAWTFVLWGSLNAAYLAIEGFFGIPRAAPVTPRSAGQWARRLAATVLTFHLITVTFTAFPSPTLSDFWYSLCGIAQLDNLRATGLLPVIIGAAVFLVDVPQNAANDDTVCLRLPWWPQSPLNAGRVFAMLLYGEREGPCIDFQY